MDVYEAAANPEFFHEVGNRITQFARGGRAHFLLFDAATGRKYLSELSGERDDFEQEYNGIYLPHDFRVPRVLALPAATFTDERSYVAPEESRTSAIHQDLLARYGVHNIHGAHLSTERSSGWFGLSVRERNGDFDLATHRALSGLVRHMHRAYSTLKSNADLCLDRNLMAAAIDDLPSAMLISSAGRVVTANNAIKDLLADGFFRLLGAKLGCRDPDEALKLADLQDDQAGTTGKTIIIRDRRAGESFTVRRRVLFPQVGPYGHLAGREHIITITPLASSCAPEPHLLDAFSREHGLTGREAEVVAVILQGGTLESLAYRRNVTLDTIRKQLKAAIARLDVASQKDIVRLFERFRLAG
jgi:DNA-binding CsgD family transcriptional regulator